MNSPSRPMCPIESYFAVFQEVHNAGLPYLPPEIQRLILFKFKGIENRVSHFINNHIHYENFHFYYRY